MTMDKAHGSRVLSELYQQLVIAAAGNDMVAGAVGIGLENKCQV